MNNSATTRTITKIALEYNGNDKGTAEMVASNCLLSSTSEGQFLEMKTFADRNTNVKKWALTGYVSQPDEIGRKLTDEEFTEIATKALEKIGVSDRNQFRLDIHNSTKQKHIHFIVNRIDISGKCTVKSHDVGRRFGEAVREVCKEKGLLTDVEIGIQKKAEMLKNLKETLKSAKNFDELIFKMKERGFEIQLSKNVKDGVSGMRIVMEKDKNLNTDRIYKAGYKLSEITSKLKIADIKTILNENREKKLDDETVISENRNQENNGNELKSNSIISEVGIAIEQFLKPTYTSNSDDELLKKKKRKSR